MCIARYSVHVHVGTCTCMCMGYGACTYTYTYVAAVHVYPYSHSLVPVLPCSLVDYVQLPSTYIMGIHSSLRDKVEDDLVRRLSLPPSLSFSLSRFLPPLLSLSPSYPLPFSTFCLHLPSFPSSSSNCICPHNATPSYV